MYSGERPIDRVISDYKFNIHSNRLSQMISHNDFIKDQVNNHRDNLMTRQFSGLYGKDEIIKFNHYEKR